MIEKSLTGLLANHVPDERVRKEVKRATDYFQACNRREQRPMTPNAIIRFLMLTVGGQNPQMTKAELSALVMEIVDRAMRPHAGHVVKTSSPTARDLTRTARKQTLANLKKYR